MTIPQLLAELETAARLLGDQRRAYIESQPPGLVNSRRRYAWSWSIPEREWVWLTTNQPAAEVAETLCRSVASVYSERAKQRTYGELLPIELQAMTG